MAFPTPCLLLYIMGVCSVGTNSTSLTISSRVKASLHALQVKRELLLRELAYINAFGMPHLVKEMPHSLHWWAIVFFLFVCLLSLLGVGAFHVLYL